MSSSESNSVPLIMDRIPCSYFSELSDEDQVYRISIARSERDSYKESEAQKKKSATKKSSGSSKKRASSSDKAAAMLKKLSSEQLAKLKSQGIL